VRRAVRRLVETNIAFTHLMEEIDRLIRPRSLAVSTTKHAHTIQALMETVLHVPSSAECLPA